MRKIITTTFVTLDGVMQAPGGPEEDTDGGFAYGGWQIDWAQDKIADDTMNKFMKSPYDLLLGKKTYEIFAGFWPKHEDFPLFGESFKIAKKYVVSHNPVELPWKNSELVTGDVVAEIKKLKEIDGPDLCVWGSGNLIQTLLEYNLIDQMLLWIYPLTLGTGKRLFAEGTRPEHFKVVDSQITPTGIIIARYEPLNPIEARS
jgi:dihydrofolate reductase